MNMEPLLQFHGTEKQKHFCKSKRGFLQLNLRMKNLHIFFYNENWQQKSQSLTIIRVVRSGFPPKTNRKRTENSNFFLYNSFVCSFARSFENFSNFSSRRRDRFGPKIVKFRAILAIFRPFEDFEFETAPKRSIWIRFELQGPPKGPAARIEFKCYSLVINISSPFYIYVHVLLGRYHFLPLAVDLQAEQPESTRAKRAPFWEYKNMGVQPPHRDINITTIR